MLLKRERHTLLQEMGHELYFISLKTNPLVWLNCPATVRYIAALSMPVTCAALVMLGYSAINLPFRSYCAIFFAKHPCLTRILPLTKLLFITWETVESSKLSRERFRWLPSLNVTFILESFR